VQSLALSWIRLADYRYCLRPPPDKHEIPIAVAVFACHRGINPPRLPVPLRPIRKNTASAARPLLGSGVEFPLVGELCKFVIHYAETAQRKGFDLEDTYQQKKSQLRRLPLQPTTRRATVLLVSSPPRLKDVLENQKTNEVVVGCKIA